MAMTEERKIRGGCVYRALVDLCLVSTGDWIPKGSIVDLSDSTDKCILARLRQGAIETAEGTPINTPLGKITRTEPCPCKNKE
jgi:hypothetical protein